MIETAKQPDLVYDVGMHKGEDTEFYLKKGFRVVSFEADAALAAHCRNRFSEAIDSGQLTIVEGAILDPSQGRSEGETVTFYRNLDKSVWGTVSADWAERNERLGKHSEAVEVPVVEFDKRLQAFGVPHYLKIDIEGMDTVCLDALLAFEHKPNYLSIESEKISFEKLLAELDLMRRLGYEDFKAVQQQFISRQREPNPAREGRFAGHRFVEGASGLFGADLPGEWADYDAIVAQYRDIFRRYERWGDAGRFTSFAPSRFAVKAFSRLSGIPIPGWYDTHARHVTAR